MKLTFDFINERNNGDQDETDNEILQINLLFFGLWICEFLQFEPLKQLVFKLLVGYFEDARHRRFEVLFFSYFLPID